MNGLMDLHVLPDDKAIHACTNTSSSTDDNF